jgi:hypothetical protein
MWSPSSNGPDFGKGSFSFPNRGRELWIRQPSTKKAKPGNNPDTEVNMNIKDRIKLGLGILCLLVTGAMVNAQGTASTTNQGIASTTVQAGHDTVTGIGNAATEVAGAVKYGGDAVVEKSHWVWSDAVQPAFQRMITALPSIFKALVLLLAFWILARIAGAIVSKLLGLTKVDDRPPATGASIKS